MKFARFFLMIFMFVICGCSAAAPDQTMTPTQTVFIEPSSTFTALPTTTPSLLPTAKPTADPRVCIPDDTSQLYGTVVSIIDGDTIRVDIDGLVYAVRYIGVSAPSLKDPVEHYANEATARNKELVYQKAVTLIQDVSDMDSYGRKLRYVLVDNLFVNQALIVEGYAEVYEHQADTACQETFQRAEQMAGQNMLGIWALKALPLVEETEMPTP